MVKKVGQFGLSLPRSLIVLFPLGEILGGGGGVEKKRTLTREGGGDWRGGGMSKESRGGTSVLAVHIVGHSI